MRQVSFTLLTKRCCDSNRSQKYWLRLLSQHRFVRNTSFRYLVNVASWKANTTKMHYVDGLFSMINGCAVRCFGPNKVSVHQFHVTACFGKQIQKTQKNDDIAVLLQAWPGYNNRLQTNATHRNMPIPTILCVLWRGVGGGFGSGSTRPDRISVQCQVKKLRSNP